MYGYSVARKPGRYLVTIFIALLTPGCGGGGAALEPDQAQEPGNPATPSAPPAPPAAPPAAPGVPSPIVISTAGSRFNPATVTLQGGGAVTWQFSGATHNVTFEDIAPPGGNIPNSAPGTSASRTFTGEGDYDYFCTIHDGMKGRIRVR